MSLIKDADTKKRLGMAAYSKAYQWRIGALGRAAMRKVAMQQAEAYRVHLEWPLRQPSQDITGDSLPEG
jgi:hypothetical protein